MDSLKRKNSSGHDTITSDILKDIKHTVCIPLTNLFNKSIETGTVPDLLKLAKIIPIYKFKNKELLNNYRPISLLPTVSKLLDKIVHKRLYNFLNTHAAFYPSIYYAFEGFGLVYCKPILDHCYHMMIMNVVLINL